MKYLCILTLTLCAVFNVHSAEPVRISAVGGVPTPTLTDFNRKLSDTLKKDFAGKTEISFDFSMGYPQKAIDLFSKAKESKASCILAEGIQLPALAYQNDFPVPVIQFFWNEPSKPNPNIARVVIDAPVEQYCTALKECGWEGGTLAVVMDEGSFFEDAQADKLGKKYRELFTGSNVEKIKVDPQTCAILMDLVSAYNMFKSKNIKAVYISSSGNTSKIFPFILKVAKKLNIAVLTNKVEALKMGGCFALQYDEDKFIKTLSSVITNELSGKHTAEAIRFTDFTLICNPDNMIKYGLELPENSTIKTDDGR